MKKFKFYLLAALLALLASCEDSEAENSPAATITITKSAFSFTNKGGSSAFTIAMSGYKWVATSNQSWCTVSKSSSSMPVEEVSLTASANASERERTAKITIVMDQRDTLVVSVTQEGFKVVYPDYSSSIPADASGVPSNAKTLAYKIKAGWNLGNSLEVPGNEVGWGNAKASQQLIDSVKKAGINAVRIPCAWDSYIEDATTCKIKASWIARVKEVVDYCVKNDMYAIINIHWDGGWLENNPTYEKQGSINAKQKALWQQIAVAFRDYDEHLLFAGTNEVHASGDPTAENFEVQLSFNQTFVDAVRSTGGKNAYRNLIIQSYNTNIDQAVSHLVMPKDAAANRLMAEIHYYDPWDFCGLEADASWATVKYFWGASFAKYGPISSWGQEDHVKAQMQKLKSTFVDKGIPVIMGEFGASRRSSLAGDKLTNHLASRAYYLQYVTQQAKNYGVIPFIWDNGATGNNGMGIFNRADGSTFDRQALEAFIKGATDGIYPM